MKLRELSGGIAEGKWTCTQLLEESLQKIKAIDREGRRLNTVAELSGDVFFEARRIDEEIRQFGLKSPLHGIPVLLKDNIDVKGMHTTAGSLALSDLIAEQDAFLTMKLREAGALILGKTNLSEFAYFMSEDHMPSGYSSRGGQVDHAYVPNTDPSGSSSGSAVAAAARLVPYTIGTETDGSLMSPAIINSIVTIKPTVGLVSRSGILPLSHEQDTAGPMCTSVEDAADILQAIAGRDEEDAATAVCRIGNYHKALDPDGSGLNVGIFRNGISAEAEEALNRAKELLQRSGANVTEVEIECIELDEMECLKHEFKYGLNRYLSSHHSRCRSLRDIIDFNFAHAEECLRYGQSLLLESEAKSSTLTEAAYLQNRMELRRRSHELLDGTLERYGVDCLLSAGDKPIGNLAPISGNPCMTIPARSQNGKDYHPLGYTILAGAFEESVLLHTAYILETGLQVSCIPDLKEQ